MTTLWGKRAARFSNRLDTTFSRSSTAIADITFMSYDGSVSHRFCIAAIAFKRMGHDGTPRRMRSNINTRTVPYYIVRHEPVEATAFVSSARFGSVLTVQPLPEADHPRKSTQTAERTQAQKEHAAAIRH